MNLNISIAMTVRELTHASETLLAMANALPTTLTDEHTGGDTFDNIDADNSHNESKISVSEGGTMMPELDKAGFPWDERIHGEAKKKTAKDKRWTKIKNLDKNSPGLFDTVIAELIAAGFGNAETDTTTTTNNDIKQGDTAPPPPPANDLAPAPAPDTAPPPPENATVETVKYILSDGKHYTYDQLLAANHTVDMIRTYPLAPTETVVTNTVDVTFPELMSLITPALSSNTISQAQVDQALSVHGLTSLPLLSAQPQLVPAVKTALFG